MEFHPEVVHEILPYVNSKVIDVPKSLHYLDAFKIINVTGDGWCGYYVLGLLAYVIKQEILNPKDVLNRLNKIHSKHNFKNHWLEIYEFAELARKYNVNVGAFRKENNKYKLNTIYYKSLNQPWIFVVIRDNSHYQILCRPSGKYYHIDFPIYEAKWVFELMGTIYPTYQTDLKTILSSYDGNDFQVIHGSPPKQINEALVNRDSPKKTQDIIKEYERKIQVLKARLKYCESALGPSPKLNPIRKKLKNIFRGLGFGKEGARRSAYRRLTKNARLG